MFMKKYFKPTTLFIILLFIFLYKDIIYLIPLEILNINYDNLAYNEQMILSILASVIVIITLIIIYKKY